MTCRRGHYVGPNEDVRLEGLHGASCFQKFSFQADLDSPANTCSFLMRLHVVYSIIYLVDSCRQWWWACSIYLLGLLILLDISEQTAQYHFSWLYIVVRKSLHVEGFGHFWYSFWCLWLIRVNGHVTRSVLYPCNENRYSKSFWIFVWTWSSLCMFIQWPLKGEIYKMLGQYWVEWSNF